MEFDDVSSIEKAVELFQYSLNKFDDNPGVRERLSAALRTMGRLDQSADELFRGIQSLEDIEGVVDATTLCMLYLDLGSLIDDLLPLPGAGCELIDGTRSECDAPKFSFCKELEGDVTTALTCFECYRKAIGLDSQCGLAHKKLADALAVIGQTEEAMKEFELAAKYLPDDICCATHVKFASQKRNDGMLSKPAIPLANGLELGKTLGDISAEFKGIEESSADLAARFERNGVLVFPQALSNEDIKVLFKKIDEIIASVDSDDSSVADLTDETKAPKQRIHMALPLLESELYTTVISDMMGRLHPLISTILQCNDGNNIPLLGSGFMQTSPGANAQDLHKDVHHWDRHEPFHDMPPWWDCNLNSYPRCISIQIQLTDTTLGGTMGSLEVMPGSHRPDTSVTPSCISRAVKDSSIVNGVIPIDVPAGTVTIYSSRLWHRGGANDSETNRRFCFFTATEDGAGSAPAGLIHTMQMEDIGKWEISAKDGLTMTY